MSKYIFVTGGVVSSLGKGIVVASVGRILKSRGVSVSVQKLDPYLNVDPGTMSPYQHGEVFVTKDGCETDLDLGHYERFIDIELTRNSNITAGQIYASVIARERKGDYLGGTIQTVPHVTNAIKERIIALTESSGADIVVVEVGGTVGDIEGLPFLEAIRQIRNDVGRDNVFYIHMTLLPYLEATGELKTKPTQHSVKELRSIGIQPDAIICRSDHPVSSNIKEKVALFCDVRPDAVIPLNTVSNIYEVPLILQEFGLGELLINSLDIKAQERDLKEWQALTERMQISHEIISIAIVGKYVGLQDSYISVKEALRHAAAYHGRRVEITWVNSEDIERDGPDKWLDAVAGIVIPGGFGPRGIEGKIETVRYARENLVPYLGLCLGMQLMVIEIARHLLGLGMANSTEFEPDTPHPVIDLMPDQRSINDMGGTMRLGLYPCNLVSKTRAAAAYQVDTVHERHRHRFEFNNNYREALQSAGLITSGLSPDGRLVEISELANHPFMLGTQFHPEFLSRPNKPHPLFKDFIGVGKNILRQGSQTPLQLEESVNVVL
jgi:CTP synthase